MDEQRKEVGDVTGSLVFQEWIRTDPTIPMGWALVRMPGGDRPFRVLSDERVNELVRQRFTERNREVRRYHAE